MANRQQQKATKRACDNEGKPVGMQTPSLTPVSMNAYWKTLHYIDTTPTSLRRICIFAQCDDEGQIYAVLQEITDHKNDRQGMHTSTVHKMTRKGSHIPKATFKGWKLLCYWKDEYSVWVDLQHSKNFNPIYAAEYAVANKIQDEPAFKWWVPETLQSQNQINGKPKSRYCWKTSTILAFGCLTQFKSLTD